MHIHDRQRALEPSPSSKQQQRFRGLAICGLIAIAVLGGAALAQPGRSGQGREAGPTATPRETGINPFTTRLPEEPSPFGYLVYDWDGPLPGFGDL
jgi:hypothetical protein